MYKPTKRQNAQYQRTYRHTANGRAIHRKHHRAKINHLRALLRAIKLNEPCKDCKQIFPPVCLDFDHVKGKKWKKLSAVVVSGVSDARLLEEIDKCEIVCANCHRLRHETDIVTD